MSKHDELAETLAETLIREIENNPGQWSKPWKADGLASYPHNVTTNKPYTGGNVFVLFMIGNARGYATGQWATFKQWNAAGCKIRKGETGTKLARWNVVYKHPGKAKSQSKKCCDQCKKAMIPTTFTVFNAAQVEGDVTAAPDFPTGRPATLPGADDVRAYFQRVGANWREVASDGAYYAPGGDYIVTPKAEQFATVGGFAGTVAHEFTHWTGHADRVPRDLTGKFGSESYALEELVAELGAVIICNFLGLEHQPLETHAAYLANWLQALKSDEGPTLLWKVAGKASKAAEFITDRASDAEAVAA